MQLSGHEIIAIVPVFYFRFRRNYSPDKAKSQTQVPEFPIMWLVTSLWCRIFFPSRFLHATHVTEEKGKEATWMSSLWFNLWHENSWEEQYTSWRYGLRCTYLAVENRNLTTHWFALPLGIYLSCPVIHMTMVNQELDAISTRKSCEIIFYIDNKKFTLATTVL